MNNAYAVNLTMDDKTDVLCTIPGSVLGMAAQPTAAQASTDGQAVTKNSASSPAFSAPGWLKWLLIPLGLIVLFVLWFVLTCICLLYTSRCV